MKEVNKEVLKDAANRLYFDMTDAEYDTLLDEFDAIKKQFELMGEIQGVDEEMPMTFPFDVSVSFLRDDIPEEPLSRDEVLANAQSKRDGQIKLPKVVG